MNDSTRCVRFLVSGIVQGVGYRYATVQAARESGLAGWVRNRPDGTVEVIARGTDAALAGFEQWLQRGPRLARVAEVSRSASDEPVADGFSAR